MKGFRQIRTDNRELMQVQDAVRDALKSLEKETAALRDSLGGVFFKHGLASSGIANTTNTQVGDGLELPRGGFLIAAGYKGELVMTSGSPTTLAMTARVFNRFGDVLIEDPSGTPGTGLGVGSIGATTTNIFRQWVKTQGFLQWDGGPVFLRARFSAVGGTISSRNALDGFIHAWRVS